MARKLNDVSFNNGVKTVNVVFKIEVMNGRFEAEYLGVTHHSYTYSELYETIKAKHFESAGIDQWEPMFLIQRPDPSRSYTDALRIDIWLRGTSSDPEVDLVLWKRVKADEKLHPMPETQYQMTSNDPSTQNSTRELQLVPWSETLAAELVTYLKWEEEVGELFKKVENRRDELRRSIDASVIERAAETSGTLTAHLHMPGRLLTGSAVPLDPMRFQLFMEGTIYGERNNEADLGELVMAAVNSPSRPTDRPPSLELFDVEEQRYRPELVKKHLPAHWQDEAPLPPL